VPLPAGLALEEAVALFAVAAVFIIGGGITLARAGDEIATRTGLGGALVGMLLLASATSLPEVTITATAAAAGHPDLAIGDLFGASMANMATLALVDLFYRRRFWPQVDIGHGRLAGIAIALTTIPLLAILAHPGVALGWIGVESLAIVAGYIAAARWLHRDRGARRRERTGEIIAPTGWGRAVGGRLSNRAVVVRFVAAAAVILLAAPLIATSAGVIADETGIGETFIGALLLALATSMPELVASFAAVQIGAYDLAVGNLFGSNAFNMTAILVADLAYTDGPVLAAVDPSQAVAGLGAVLLMAIALTAIVHGDRTRLHRLEPDALLLLGVYVLLLLAVLVAGR